MWWLKQMVHSTLGYRVDPDELDAYRTVIPSEVNVNIQHRGGVYVARVRDIEGAKLKDGLLITEAKNTDELVLMVNDLILTYKNVPERIRPYLKQILKPEHLSSKAKELTLIKA